MKSSLSRVSRNGGVTIPVALRNRLGISAGTLILFEEKDGQLLLQPITIELIKTLRGSLKSKGDPLKTLFEERKKSRH